MDLQSAWVAEWRGGCLYCRAPAEIKALPESDGQLLVPFCATHRRWAMASRRESFGRDNRHLRRLLMAWAALRGIDRDLVKRWLG
jgi:hypothetical protein